MSSRRTHTLAIVALFAAVSAGAAIPMASGRIDAIIDAHMHTKGLEPAAMSDDASFVRRIYLDITGTIPTYTQARAFLESKRQYKRAELIHDLLQTEGAASHLSNYWSSLLRVQTRIQGSEPDAYAEWVRDAFRKNMPYDEFVYALLTAEGDSHENPATGYFLRDRRMRFDTVAATAQVFLGTQIGCAQCHDSKFDDWTQKDFYQFAAFMHAVDARPDAREARALKQKIAKTKDDKEQARLRRELRNLPVTFKDDPKRRLRLPDDYVYDNGKPKQVVNSDVLFGKLPKAREGDTERDRFARWLTAPSNPLFTKVAANRLWKRAIGVGVFEPVDDYNEFTRPSSPELLDALSAELKRVDYDLRRFMEIIYNTRMYQRATSGDDVDVRSYAFTDMPLRRMSAEQIWDSLQTLALGSSDADAPAPRRGSAEPSSDMSPSEGSSARQEEGSSMREMTARKPAGRKSNSARRSADLPQPSRPGDLTDQFGRSDRETITEGSTDPSIPQVLMLMNGKEIERLLESRNAYFVRDLRRMPSVSERIDRLYLSILTRSPSAAERERAETFVRNVDRSDRAYQDLSWALLNSREFLFVR